MKNTKLICAGILLMASAVAQAAGIAFVTNVKGDAKADSSKLVLMAELNRGQKIGCAAECTIGVMFLQSGKEFVVKGPGEYLVGDNEITTKIGVPPAVRDTQWRVSSQTLVQVAQTSSASVRMRSLSSASAQAGPKPAPERTFYPVQTMVSSLQPTFGWATDNVRGPYDFELTGADGGKPLFKGRALFSTFKLPAHVKLQPETAYQWNVSAGGKEIGAGSFTTLSSASLELAQKRKPDNSASFSDWLLYGLLLQELGATHDAHEIWSRLSKDRPDLPELGALAK